jgi:hypothetical protein
MTYLKRLILVGLNFGFLRGGGKGEGRENLFQLFQPNNTENEGK